MAATPEGKVKDKIKQLLKSYSPDVYYFMPAMGSFGKSGVPDIVACIKGSFVAIEVKADKRKNPPTALQVKNLTEITAAGGAALVIDADDLAMLQGFVEGLIASRTETAKIMGELYRRFA